MTHVHGVFRLSRDIKPIFIFTQLLYPFIYIGFHFSKYLEISPTISMGHLIQLKYNYIKTLLSKKIKKKTNFFNIIKRKFRS